MGSAMGNQCCKDDDGATYSNPAPLAARPLNAPSWYDADSKNIYDLYPSTMFSLQDPPNIYHTDDGSTPSHREHHPPTIDGGYSHWQIDIIRVLLMGTHDTRSALRHLRAQHRLLELIVSLVWPELFMKALTSQILKANPSATEDMLYKKLKLDSDGCIISWDLSSCKLRTLPELFGGIRTSGTLYLITISSAACQSRLDRSLWVELYICITIGSVVCRSRLDRSQWVGVYI